MQVVHNESDDILDYFTDVEAMRMRTPKALTSLQPRVARVSALPWVTGQTFSTPSLQRFQPNPEKGWETSSALLVGFAKCLRRKFRNNKTITQPFSGLRHNAGLLPRGATARGTSPRR